MRFNYRGIQYNTTPATLPAVEGDIMGKYRGAENHLHHSIQVPESRNLRGYTIKYRGIAV